MISQELLLTKMKRVWLASKKLFLRHERGVLAKTGEGTMNATDQCADEDDSEVRLMCDFSVLSVPGVSRVVRKTGLDFGNITPIT